MNVAGLMRQAVRFNRRRTALIVPDRTLTYEEAWERGVGVANALIDMGVRPGDRVGAVEDNSLGAADFYIGAAIAGAVRVPLYARNSPEAHGAMIERTQTRVVIADAAYADSIAGLVGERGLEQLLVRDDGYESWLAQQDRTDPLIEVADDAPYVIRHSSGTSGRSKGVAYTQHGWVVNSRNWFYRLPRLTGDSVVGHAAPISHAAGYLFVPTWLQGSANLLYGTFDVPTFIEMSQRHRVTHTFLAPSMVAAAAAHPGVAELDWSALSCILTGGGPITDATIAASRRAFGDNLFQVFGQTEATPLTIMTPQEWFAETPGSTPLRSAGRVMPFVELEIRDSDSVALPTGDEGEIWTRCEAQMTEYWGDPEMSVDKVVDGWVRTGDIGRLDENGYLYVLDRADDMIVSGGFNIWPSELETAIADHPDVEEVAVFGVPDPRWGETPMAVCRLRDGAHLEAQDVIELVAMKMGSYMKPTRVEFTAEPLPKTVVGKTLRRALREPHWAGHESRVGGA